MLRVPSYFLLLSLLHNGLLGANLNAHPYPSLGLLDRSTFQNSFQLSENILNLNVFLVQLLFSHQKLGIRVFHSLLLHLISVFLTFPLLITILQSHRALQESLSTFRPYRSKLDASSLLLCQHVLNLILHSAYQDLHSLQEYKQRFRNHGIWSFMNSKGNIQTSMVRIPSVLVIPSAEYLPVLISFYISSLICVFGPSVMFSLSNSLCLRLNGWRFISLTFLLTTF